MASPSILVAENDQYVMIRLLGRVNLTCSQGLREFGMSLGSRETLNIRIDLSECEGMDSTIMGVMAMIGLEARKHNSKPQIVNATDHHKHLLGTIGLNHIYDFTHSQNGDVSWTALCQTKEDASAKSKATGQTILEAHETLMDLHPDNVPRFSDVVEHLRNDLNT